jgi:hypothetical protein
MTRNRKILLLCLVPLLGIALMASMRFTGGLRSNRFTSAGLKKADGFSWKSASSKNFIYYFEAESPAERDIDKIISTMERGRSKAEALLKGSRQLKIELFLVDSRERMKKLIGNETNAWANGTVQGSVYNDKIKAIGAHETLHCLALALWGKTEALWINEGLAVYSDDQWNGLDLHSVARWLFDQKKLLSIGALVDARNWKNQDMVTYPQSGSLVKFICENYGIEAVREFWQKGTDQGLRHIGRSLSELEKDWQLELAKHDATSIHYQVP